MINGQELWWNARRADLFMSFVAFHLYATFFFFSFGKRKWIINIYKDSYDYIQRELLEKGLKLIESPDIKLNKSIFF